jgi:exodeoxyribonuclease VII large subunit
MDIVVYPAQVQGAASPGSVATAIRQANRDGRADVVIIARGGGSFEDLYGFNTEPVVRAILASRIPVVTALGHTSDRTLADMASDAECRTPTEAGARVVPKKAELIAQLAERARRLEREGLLRVEARSRAVAGRGERLALLLPVLFAHRRRRLERAAADLGRLSPAQQLARRSTELAERARRLEAAVLRSLAQTRVNLANRTGRLEALAPEAVLARGYSITEDETTGHVLRGAMETAAGRRLRIRLAAGSLAARVEEVRR